jgi:hypothetical protein
MEEAYVINLDKNTERWQQMQDTFKDSSLKLHRYSALKMNPGSRGLTQTTIRILKLAKQRGLEHVLILEDDCVPIDGWEEVWKQIKEWLHKNPTRWDVYSGGTRNYTWCKHIETIGDISFFKPRSANCSHWLYFPARSYDTCLELYGKRNSTRKKGNTTIAPNVINGELKRLISTPFIAYQRNGFSDLKGEYRDYLDEFHKAEEHLRNREKHRRRGKNNRV